MAHLFAPPVQAWLFGHTHWSSWQRFGAGGIGRPRPLTGGATGWPDTRELLAEQSRCSFGRSVLVASNQLAYAAKVITSLIPHRETFSASIQPPYSSTKG
jgi:hypothetical protein